MNSDDRRDFILMSRAMEWRYIPGIGIRPEAFSLWQFNDSDKVIGSIDCGGDLSADWYHIAAIDK